MTNVIDGETTFAIFIFRVWLKVWNCIHFQMNNKTYFDGYLSLQFQLKKKIKKIIIIISQRVKHCIAFYNRSISDFLMYSRLINSQ